MQMLVVYAKDLQEGFADYAEEVSSVHSSGLLDQLLDTDLVCLCVCLCVCLFVRR